MVTDFRFGFNFKTGFETGLMHKLFGRGGFREYFEMCLRTPRQKIKNKGSGAVVQLCFEWDARYGLNAIPVQWVSWGIGPPCNCP